MLTLYIYLQQEEDDKFQEILSQLANDLLVNLNQHCTLLIGLDSNQSLKSSRRRTEAMSRFRAQFSLKSILVNDNLLFTTIMRNQFLRLITYSFMRHRCPQLMSTFRNTFANYLNLKTSLLMMQLSVKYSCQLMLKRQMK